MVEVPPLLLKLYQAVGKPWDQRKTLDDSSLKKLGPYVRITKLKHAPLSAPRGHVLLLNSR
jgi:hypothetical protein